MKELAEKLRSIVVMGSPYSGSIPEALARAADIIENLPEEPEGYKLTGEYRRVGPSEYYLEQGFMKRSRNRTCWEYLILEPIQPQFKPGDIVCAGGGAVRVIGKDGNLYFLDNNQTTGIRIDHCHLATDEEKEAYLKLYPEFAIVMMDRLAREVYGEKDND